MFDGDGAAVGDELRADGVAVVVHHSSHHRPEAVHADQSIALIHRAIRAGNPGAVAEVFNPHGILIVLERDERTFPAGFELYSEQIAAVHDDVRIPEMLQELFAEI